MSRTRILALLVVATLAAPGAATAAVGKAPRAKSLPVLAGAVYREAIARNGLTFGQYLEARRDFLTAPRRVGGSGLVALPAGPERDGTQGKHASLDDEWSETVLSALRLDGSDNILTVAVRTSEDLVCVACPEYLLDHDREAEIRSRDGATGQIDWSRPTPGLVYTGTFDVTGDGRSEVIAVQEQLTGPGLDAIAATVSAYQVETIVRVLDAADGSELWTASQEGTAVVAEYGLLAGARLAAIDNVMDGIMSAGDADGDLGDDVFLRTISFDLAYAVAFAGVFVAPITLTGYTLAGPDGVELGSVDADGTFVVGCVVLTCISSEVFPAIIPVGDVDSDGRADLVVAESVGGGADLSTRSVDGSRTFWSRIYPALSPDIFTYQLDGDGPDDILLSGGLQRGDVAIAGRTGAELWEGSLYPIYWAIPVGDINGDGGTDFVHRDDVYDHDEGRWNIAVSAISGAQGINIYTKVLVSPTAQLEGADGSEVTLCSWCEADLNGDGVLDMIGRQNFFENLCEPVDECGTVPTGVSAFSVDGRTGLIMEERVPDAPYTVFVPVDGDIDGDGGADLAAIDRTSGALAIASGASFSTLWSGSVPIQGNRLTALDDRPFGADVIGPAGDEVLISVRDEYYGSDVDDYVDYGTHSYMMSASGVLWGV